MACDLYGHNAQAAATAIARNSGANIASVAELDEAQGDALIRELRRLECYRTEPADSLDFAEDEARGIRAAIQLESLDCPVAEEIR